MKFRVSDFKSTIMICLSILVVGSYLVHADNPSTNNWGFGGGGFCSGDWTIYNNTAAIPGGDNKLYAEYCQSGINPYPGATDLGALMSNNIIPDCLHATTGPCGTISVRAGFFAVSTSITMGTGASSGDVLAGPNGIRFMGAGGGHPAGGNGVQDVNGTILVAKTSNYDMIRESSGSASVTCNTSTCSGTNSPIIVDDVISGFVFYNPGFAGVVGIDWRANQQAQSDHIQYNAFRGLFPNTGFAVAIYMDGCDACFVDGNDFSGDGGASDGSASVGVHWNLPSAQGEMSDNFPGSNVDWQLGGPDTSFAMYGMESGSIRLLQNLGGIVLSASPMSQAYGSPGRIQLNGFTLNQLYVDGGLQEISSTNGVAWFAGSGTVDMVTFSGTSWVFGGTPVWNLNSATLVNQVTLHNNWVISGTTPTGFPFTVTSNVF